MNQAKVKASELKSEAAAKVQDVKADALAKVNGVKGGIVDKTNEAVGRIKEVKVEAAKAASAATQGAKAAVGAAVSSELAEKVRVGAAAGTAALKEEALDSTEVEPTRSRRNVLLTVHDGDVQAALDAVGKKYLLTDRLVPR